MDFAVRASGCGNPGSGRVQAKANGSPQRNPASRRPRSSSVPVKDSGDHPSVSDPNGTGASADFDQSPPWYIASIRSSYFDAAALRLTFMVGVISPPSIVSSLARSVNFLIFSNRARSFDLSSIRFR